MQMNLNITLDNSTERTDKIINLTRVRTTNSVSDTDTVHANLVDSLVDGKKIDKVRTERVFGRESDFDTYENCELPR